MKKILVACGTGVATSTVVRDNLKRIMESENIPVEIQQCRASEIKSQIESFNPHVVVCTTDVNVKTDTPILKGLPFLTGVGENEAREKLVAILKD